MATMRSLDIFPTLVNEVHTYFWDVKGFTKDTIYDANCIVKVTRESGENVVYTSVKELESIDYDERVNAVGMVRMPFTDKLSDYADEATSGFAIQMRKDDLYWDVLSPYDFIY